MAEQVPMKCYSQVQGSSATKTDLADEAAFKGVCENIETSEWKQKNVIMFLLI